MLDEIAKIVTKSAPILGSVLGSPFASIGVSLLANLFNIDPKEKDKLLEKLDDPTISLQLKNLENTHQETLLQLISKNYETEVDDRKSARTREITLRDYVPTVLALGFLINYAIIQFYCITHNNSMNDIISARFQDVLLMIISYYFGSSHKETKMQ